MNDEPVLSTKTGTNSKPEWLRIPQAIQLFGIGRTKLYELIGNKRIKSASIRERGQVRGTRLISFDSLNEYLNTLAEEE